MTTIIQAPAKAMLYNGIYTITNMGTGDHRTIRIKTQADNAKFAAGERLIGLLSGTDNTRDYVAFGFVKGNDVAVWKSKRAAYGTKLSVYEYIAWLMPKVAHALIDDFGQDVYGVFEAAGRKYKVQLSKRCLHCNRTLTTPESIERGVGPECAKKLGI